MSQFYPSIKRAIRILYALSFLLLPASLLFSQTVVINPSSPWTVPAGVSSVKVEVWGGGGGGGGAWGGTGGGGGGGAYRTTVFAVVPGQIYTATIGVGGLGGDLATGNGGSGGTTTFTGPGGTATAAGGSPGGGSIFSAPGGGGNGGAGGTFNGGKGGTSSGNGAGGGGGAGNNGAGNPGSNTTFGTGGPGLPNVAPYIGGNGGAIITNDGNGNPGAGPGGGGGGAKDVGTFTGFNGGAGGDGQVVLTYTINLTPTITNINATTGCANTTSVIITGTNFTGATIVQFGGTNAASFIVNSDTQITAIPNTGANGTITVTTPGGTATGTDIFTINPQPTIPIVSGTGTFCASTTITADNGGDGTMYFQGTTSNGTSTAIPSTSQSITTSGTYYFRAQSASGCWSQQGSAVVTINNIPAAITVTGGGTHCGSTTITASGGTGGTIYFQGTTSGGTSTGTPTASQIISSSGTYYFRANNGCGWGAEGSVTVTIDPVPAATIVGGAGTFCNSTTITADNGGDGTMYFQGTTSNGTSTATASSTQTISTSGTYYFRSRSAAGCWGAEGSVALTINTMPAVVTVSGPATSCGSATITASGGNGGTIYFQGTTSGGTSTATPSASQVISTSGTYYFRANNGCGWGQEGSITVTIAPVLAATTVSGAGTYCGSIQVTADNGGDGTMYFQGTTANGTSTAIPSTTQTISTSGTYYFRARSAAGCWGPQGSVSVTINSVPAEVTVSGPGTSCGSALITASGGAGGTIYFQGTTSDGTSTATPSASQTVTTSGTYYFRSLSASGCWGPEGSVTVTINPAPATTTVSGAGTYCGSTTITAANGGDGTMYYQGITSNGTSTATAATSQLISTSGTYYFRARSAAGCWSPQGSVVVNINNVPTSVTASGAGTFCVSTSIAATGGTGGLIYFQGTTSGGTSTALGGTPQTITTSGTYYFRARSNSTGNCWGPEGSVTVTINPAPATTTVSGGGTVCGSTTLTASNGGDGTMYYQGTTSNGTSTATAATSQLISTSGTYYFRARSAAGCWGPQGSAVVTINSVPTAVTVNSSGTYCGNVSLTTTGGAGGTIYFQGTTSGGTSTTLGGTPQTITTSGTYYFRSRSASGCWSTEGSATVTINPLPATTTVTGGGTFCASSAIITAANGGDGTMYFQGTTSNGMSTATISTSQTVTTSGTYYFRARSTAGCWGPQGSVSVTLNSVPSAVTVSGGGTFCGSTTVTTTGGNGGTVYFQGTTSGGTSTATPATSRSITTSGTYYFRSRSGAGCWGAEGSVTVTINPTPATTIVSGAGTFCGSTIITASGGAGGTIYFQGKTNLGTSTANPSTSESVTSSGTYYFRSLSPDGCWGPQGSVGVIINATPTGSFSAIENSGLVPNDNTICAGSSITFTAPSGYNSYIFKVNGVTVKTGGSGTNTYSVDTLTNGASVTVDVANSLNCGATFGPIAITVTPLPTPTLMADKTTICKGDSITFTASGGTGYNFKVNGATVQNSTSPTYASDIWTSGDKVTVEVTNANKCSATSSEISVTVNDLPTGTFTASSTEVCAGENIIFTATGGSEYQFSVGGAIVQAFTTTNTFSSSTLNNSDVVTVEVKNGSGCIANYLTYPPIAISVNALPVGVVSVTENSGALNDLEICANAPVTYTFPTGYQNYDYRVNNISVQSSASNTYINSTLKVMDVVTVLVQSNSGCEALFTAPAVSISPSPAGTLSASALTICAGDDVTFTATEAPLNTNYNFKINGVSASTGASGTFTTNVIQDGDVVTVEVTNTNGCPTIFNPITMTVTALPTGTMTIAETSGNANNDATICAGASVTFNAPAGFTNYNFLVNGLSVQNGSSPIYSTATLANGNKVTVAVSNTGGCIALLNEITMTVDPLPVIAAITGPADVCVNADITLSNTTTGGTWSTANAAIATVDPVTGVVTGVADGVVDIYYLITSAATNCSNTATHTIKVNALPLVAAITGSLNVCVGNTTSLSSTTMGGTWSSSDVGTATVGAGGIVTGIANGSVTISYSVANIEGCMNIVTAVVNVHALPVVPAIGGTLNVCINSTTQLSNTVAGGAWTTSDPTKATVNGASGLVTGIAAGSVTINYTVTDGNGCSTMVSADVMVNSLPVPTLSGPTPICLGSVGNVYTTEAGQFEYTWNIVNGTVTSGGSPTDNTVTISWLNPGIKSINVNYKDVNGCAGVAVATVENAPGSSPVITGPSDVCLNSEIVYTTQTGKIDYNWTVNGGLITAGGTATDATVTIKWNTTGNRSVTVNFADIGGCSAASPTSYPVTVRPLPTATIAGNATVCEGSAARTITFTGSGSVAPYIFTYQVNSDPIQTVTSTVNSATVTQPTTTPGTFTYTLISVQGSGTTNCSQLQNGSVTVNITPIPVAAISYAASPVCKNSGLIQVTQTGTTGGSYLAAAGLSINGSTGEINPAGSTAGTYTVTYRIAAAGNCAARDFTTSVTITAIPSATITYNGSPFCKSATSINVTRSGSAGGTYSSTAGLSINPATGNINPSTSTAGNYVVTYTIPATGGCADFTTTANVTITTAPAATIAYSASPYCTSAGTAAVTQTGTSGGTYTAAPAGLSINSATGEINLSASTGGPYTVTYSIGTSGGCAAFSTQATVVIAQAPTAIAGTSSVLTCANNGSVNITAGSSATNYSSVLWTSSGTGTINNGNSLTAATYTPSAADITAGSVTLTLTANGKTGCGSVTSMKTLTINAVTPFLANISASPSTICLGGSSNLSIPDGTSTLMSENFQGTISFTVVNGSPHNSGSEWTLRNSSYTYNYDCFFIFCSSVTFNSGSRFMVSTSADYANTKSSIESPTISTIGYTSLNFQYRTYYRRGNNEIAVVEVSTNNGATWTTVENLVSIGDIGTSQNFSTRNINLNAYINIPSLKIRFSYQATDDFWWALDDIVLTGSAPSVKYSWAANPASTAGLPIGAEVPAFENANINVSPTATGTYTYTATLTNTAGCVSTKNVSISVNPVPEVVINANYCLVPGKVRLTAVFTPGASLIWSPKGETTSFIDVDVAGEYSVTATIGGCSVSAVIEVAKELVINGDFTNGNVGFTSDYAYKPDVAGNNELVDDSGNNGYSVSTDGQNVHNNFWGKDHTGNTDGPRNYMLVNGHGKILVVWKQTVNVLPNTTYYFSAWAMSLNNSTPYAQLQFSVNGTLVGTAPILPPGVNNNNNGYTGTARWTRFYGSWTSGPTETTADIYINNLEAALGGNDFGLDDISFGTLSTFITLESAPGTDAQTICKNAPIENIVYNVGNGNAGGPNVTGLPNGITSSFAGDKLTISGTPTAAGSTTYTITTTGCNPFTVTGTITVQEQNIILSAGNTAPVCKGAAMLDRVYALSGTATGATVSALPSGVTGVLSADGKSFTISGTPGVAGTFPYTITTSGNCAAATISGSITVQEQTITLNSPAPTANQALCINTAIANIQYMVAGTANNASVTGLPAGVTGKYLTGVFTISGTPTVAGIFNYTVTTSGTCGPVTANGTINVTPAATIALTSAAGTNAQIICNNTAITPITYLVNSATGASITGGNLPAGITGAFNAGTFTISGSAALRGTYSYTITTTGGCASATASGTITVNGQSIVLSSGTASPSVCANAPITDIVFTRGGDATDASITGQPAGISGTRAGNVFTVSGIPTGAPGPYNYTITTSGSSSCAPATFSGTITILPPAIAGTITAPVLTCSGGSGSVTLVGSVGTITWQVSTDGGTTWNNTSPVNHTITQTFTNLTSATQFRAQVGNALCGNVYSNIAVIGIHNLWTGAIDTDWNTAGNWSDNQLPSLSCPNVYIPNTTNKPVLSSGTGTIRNIYIDAGGVLTVNGTGILQIAGTINNSGTFDVHAGEIELNGTTVQNIGPGTFMNNAVKDFRISNSTGVNLNNDLDIYGSLTFGTPNAKINTNGNLTLKSNIDNTAWVGQMTTTQIITGEVTVERFINTGVGGTTGAHRKSWQLLAVPTNGAQTIKQAWQEGATLPVNSTTPNQNPAGNPKPGYGTMIVSNAGGTDAGAIALGFDQFTAPGPSIKVWNSTTDGYDGPPNTLSSPIYNIKGYMILVRGDRSVYTSSAPAVPTTLRSKGSLFTPANPPNSVSVAPTLFESVGNPYASAIDLRKISVGGGLVESFIVWDPRAQGEYSLGAFTTLTKTGTDFYATPGSTSYPSTTTPYNTIESGQAFFIQATGMAGSVGFTESAKVSGSNAQLLRGQGEPERQAQLRTNLYVGSGNNLTLADGNLIQYDTSYSNGLDRLDARKMTNTSENLGIVSNGETLAVERRAPIVETDTVFYKIYGMRVQPYKLEFIANDLAEFGVEGILEDNYLKTKMPLNMEGTTEYNFSIENIPGSFASDRFRIVFKAAAGPLPVTFVSVKATQQSDDIAVDWKVENETNMKEYEVEKSMDGNRFIKSENVPALNNGAGNYSWLDKNVTPGWNYYRIKSIDQNGKISYTEVVRVLIELEAPLITVYPNPIVNGVINVHLVNQPAGTYKLRLLNALGQSMVTKQVTRNKGTSIEPLTWDYKLARGNYRIEITKPDGEVKVITVIY